MNKKFIIVDVQGFKDCKNNFIVKEFALATSGNTQVFLVKPPYPFSKLSNEEKRRVLWIEKKLGIYWSEGYIDYLEFKRIIKSILSTKIIILKGMEKIGWVKELCNNITVIDLGAKECPNFKKLRNEYSTDDVNLNCIFHNNECAVKNVICLQNWCKHNSNIHLNTM